MKTVAFMPIKLNNERVPEKNIKKMDDGKILMSFMLDTLVELKKQGTLDDIIVFCSKEDICKYLPKEVAWMKRPEFLDSQSAKSNDIIASFLGNYDADYYAMCHATSPFMRGIHIKECIEAVKTGKYDSAFCAREIRSFLWQNQNPLNFVRNDYPRTQDMLPIYEELPTPYVFTKEVFFDTGGRTGMNPYICKCSAIEAIDIDEPADFELANAMHMSGIDKIVL